MDRCLAYLHRSHHARRTRSPVHRRRHCLFLPAARSRTAPRIRGCARLFYALHWFALRCYTAAPRHRTGCCAIHALRLDLCLPLYCTRARCRTARRAACCRRAYARGSAAPRICCTSRRNALCARSVARLCAPPHARARLPRTRSIAVRSATPRTRTHLLPSRTSPCSVLAARRCAHYAHRGSLRTRCAHTSSAVALCCAPRLRRTRTAPRTTPRCAYAAPRCTRCRTRLPGRWWESAPLLQHTFCTNAHAHLVLHTALCACARRATPRSWSFLDHTALLVRTRLACLCHTAAHAPRCALHRAHTLHTMPLRTAAHRTAAHAAHCCTRAYRAVTARAWFTARRTALPQHTALRCLSPACWVLFPHAISCTSFRPSHCAPRGTSCTHARLLPRAYHVAAARLDAARFADRAHCTAFTASSQLICRMRIRWFRSARLFAHARALRLYLRARARALVLSPRFAHALA